MGHVLMNTLDERLDRLSQEARSALGEFRGLHMVIPATGPKVGLAPHIRELIQRGFFRYADPQPAEEFKLTITADGNSAQLRLNSGLWQHHWQQRQSRYDAEANNAAMAGSPLFGIF